MQTVDALLGAYQGAVPGAGVLVVRDGISLCRRAYGLADVENGIASSTATNYRLASVTKQFTSAAILLLAEEGRLSIDDPVRSWLPTLPPAADEMIIRHLLAHRSGLVDFEALIPLGATAQLHDADVLKLLEAEDRGYFRPGSGYRYSNSGYSLLALIVERAAGRDFAVFLRERIFRPLGMHDTLAFEAGISTVPHRAYGYSLIRNAWLRSDQSATSATLGDGGVYSSIDDLAKWDAALYDDRLLRPASLRLLFAPASPTDEPAVQYGFGWRISGDSVWHSGESLGFRNVIVRFPKRRLTVIMLTNRNYPEPYPAALAFAGLRWPER